jgi:hypothetical protein
LRTETFYISAHPEKKKPEARSEKPKKSVLKPETEDFWGIFP